MSIWEKSRFQIWNQSQHPYKHLLADFMYINPRLPGLVNLEQTMNYIVSVLYPKYITTVDTKADLPATADPNDYVIVTDDGDGRSAGYVWCVIDSVGQWVKRYDQDWSMESILAETVNRTLYMYSHKYGMTDRDADGNPLTGDLAGQHLYGGDEQDQHLTLHANSGDTLGGRSGFIQVDDPVRPTEDAVLGLGEAARRFSEGYFVDIFTGTLTSSSDVAIGGDLAVVGAITAGGNITGANLTGTNHGDVTLGTLDSETKGADGAVIVAGTASTPQSLVLQTADSAAPGLVSTGAQTFAGNKTFEGSVVVEQGFHVVGDALVGGDLDIFGNVQATNLTGANYGDMTLADLDSEPRSALGATIIAGDALSPQALALQTADETAPGLVSTVDQVFAGVKTFQDGIITEYLTVNQDASIYGNLELSGNINSGSFSITMDALMALSHNLFRDEARTQPAQTGDSLFWHADLGIWLASAPDEEVVHNTITLSTDPLDDDGHGQFVMLAGRTGGQTIQGGRAAGENLVLDPTSHGSKGSVLLRGVLSPETTAAYSGGTWQGLDLGDATHRFRDLHMRGELRGARVENFVGDFPANSGQNVGRLGTLDGILAMDTGADWVPVVMTEGEQAIGGSKSFQDELRADSGLIVTGEFVVDGTLTTYSSAVASQALLTSDEVSAVSSFVRITGAVAGELTGIASPLDGRRVILHNQSSANQTLKHEVDDEPWVYRIQTPTGGNLTIKPGASVELIYNGATSRWVVASSGAGGGAGGGSFKWVEDGNSPLPVIENGMEVYVFDHGLEQQLFAVVAVPMSYASGTQIRLRLNFYTEGTSGTAQIFTDTSLLRRGVPVDGFPWTHPGSPLPQSVDGTMFAVTLDLTDESGMIGDAEVQPGDILKVKLFRDQFDTATSQVKLLAHATEVTFS